LGGRKSGLKSSKRFASHFFIRFRQICLRTFLFDQCLFSFVYCKYYHFYARKKACIGEQANCIGEPEEQLFTYHDFFATFVVTLAITWVTAEVYPSTFRPLFKMGL